MYLNFSFCFQVIKLKPEIELCNIYEWCNEAFMICFEDYFLLKK